MTPFVVTVKQLNAYVKSLLDGDSRLAYISIRGEISNFKEHFSSGHLYFTLKDNDSTLKCVMFKGNASRLKFLPKEGMQVICTGRISVFERDGIYQLYAENMVPDGEGDLLAAFEKLKKKLESEGLFSPERKKPIPKFPKCVGVITSETGAAIRDIFSVLGRRYPLCNIVFCPATVQGSAAPNSLCNALDLLEKTEADVVIIGRGGGSIEDLWCFNDEKLARRIAAFSKPVISAVGHETDFTLCDFVSDLRAPTPSAAAELAVPNAEELYADIKGFSTYFEKRISEMIMLRESKLDKVLKSRAFEATEELICEKRSLTLDRITDKMQNTVDSILKNRENALLSQITKLDALSPSKTLLRGYAVVEKQNTPVTSVCKINKNDKLSVRLNDGRAECLVENIIKE